jgi:hypothetical protein
VVTKAGHDALATGDAWPTPTQQRGLESGTQRDWGGDLTAAIKWPTPAARDYKDSGHEPSAQARNSPCLPASAVMDADQAPGVLNPAWVELLMGLPSGWTDLDANARLDRAPLACRSRRASARR